LISNVFINKIDHKEALAGLMAFLAFIEDIDKKGTNARPLKIKLKSN